MDIAVAIRIWALALFLLIVAGCRSAAPDLPAPPPAPGPDLTFTVRVAGLTPLQELTGVAVTGISRTGERHELGRTFAGRVTVAKERIRSADIQVLLFWHIDFQCTAIDLTRFPSLLEFDEWDVDLARVVIYD